MEKEKLFEPVTISGVLHLRNRIVRSATYEKRADEDGFATDSLISMYEALASGGTGLIITGVALVHPSGRLGPKMLSVHSDRYIDALTRLTDRVHGKGGAIALQIVHGGRQCLPIFIGGALPMAPSAVYDPSSDVTPRAMTDSEIWSTIDAFADAARRARIAGFDAVQIHAAHGYLASNFISPHTNRRDDYWGGDEERRFHFLEEVFQAMRAEAGEGFPILAKMNCDDLLPEGGLKPEEAARVAVRLAAIGLDAVEISGGMRESPIKTIRPAILKETQEAYFRQAGALFKKKLYIPVILTGGMRSRRVMEDVLRRQEADMIGMSRPLIREPDLPNLMMQGKEKADCISCNKCANFVKYETVECIELLGKD
ncbi:MAG: NADH:flavin oxidoreductase [Nitrospiraceae bacterium]|nr:NADH:flavin oxidoreductase [Nitrospiraceae bacterium]